MFCQAGACVSGCEISGVFYAPTTRDPANSCQVCRPSSSTTSWTVLGNGAACNDGNACTQTDKCSSGTCVGSNPVSCTPQDACHTASCDPSSGACVQAIAQG